METLAVGKEVMTVLCEEPEGDVARTVRLAPLTPEFILEVWGRIAPFPTLFNEHIRGPQDFIRMFIGREEGQIVARGILWLVDDVGIMFLTNIYPGFQATAHVTFWDRRLKGREPLMRKMLQYAFREYGFHRIVAEVPLYARPLFQMIPRVGFKKEGRARKVVRYEGEWWDAYNYSILREEALDGFSET